MPVAGSPSSLFSGACLLGDKAECRGCCLQLLLVKQEQGTKMSIINSFESGIGGPEYVPKVLDLIHTETYCSQRGNSRFVYFSDSDPLHITNALLDTISNLTMWILIFLIFDNLTLIRYFSTFWF